MLSVFIIYIWRIPVAGCAVGLRIRTALGVAGVTLWCAGIRRCSSDSVAGRALGGEFARCRDHQIVVEILYIVDDEVVTVVAGIWYVAELDADLVAGDAY